MGISSSPRLPAAVLADQLQGMRWHEIACYETFDYVRYSSLSHESAPNDAANEGAYDCEKIGSLEGTLKPTKLPVISPQWREVICQWAYKLVDHFSGPRRVVGVGMHFVDRYLCVCESLCGGGSQGSMSKRQFKLLCLACLHLALKIERPNLIPLDTLLSLSRGMFTRERVIAMEKDVLQKLQWRLHPPIALDFLESYALQLLGDRKEPAVGFEEIVNSARYMLELSVIDYFFVSHRPSHVAIGALLNALDGDPNFLWNSNPSCFSTLLSLVEPIELPNILICKTRIHAIQAQMMEPKRSTPPSVPTWPMASRKVDSDHDCHSNQTMGGDGHPSSASQPPGTWVVVSPVDVLNYYPPGSSK